MTYHLWTFLNTFELSSFFIHPRIARIAARMAASELPLGDVLWMGIRIILDDHEKFSRSLKIMPSDMNNIRKPALLPLVSYHRALSLQTSENVSMKVKRVNLEEHRSPFCEQFCSS